MACRTPAGGGWDALGAGGGIDTAWAGMLGPGTGWRGACTGRLAAWGGTTAARCCREGQFWLKLVQSLCCWLAITGRLLVAMSISKRR